MGLFVFFGWNALIVGAEKGSGVRFLLEDGELFGMMVGIRGVNAMVRMLRGMPIWAIGESR